MKNFYFVATFNMHSPLVRKYLEDTLLLIDPGMTVDFKLRSKLFNGYNETINGAAFDFNCRLEVFLEDDQEFHAQELVIVNPKFAVNPELMEAAAKEMKQDPATWDDYCTAAIFFIDEDSPSREWLLKYEVYYAEDTIELSQNGELELFLQLQDAEDKFPTLLH